MQNDVYISWMAGIIHDCSAANENNNRERLHNFPGRFLTILCWTS